VLRKESVIIGGVNVCRSFVWPDQDAEIGGVNKCRSLVWPDNYTCLARQSCCVLSFVNRNVLTSRMMKADGLLSPIDASPNRLITYV
jgi:hypothetical protein